MTFTHTLNLIWSHIQFTIKKEHNFSLPFLDVLVKRNSRNGNTTTHGLLSTTIYRKPTHTNRYLHYTSHHPKHQKITVAKTLLSRVNRHITDKTQKHSELQNIRNTLRLNGFPSCCVIYACLSFVRLRFVFSIRRFPAFLQIS